MKEKNIIYRSKYGLNKAFLAEHYIYIVKKYLYMTLRGTLNQNWVESLEKIVLSMNNTPINRLGFLKPNDITTEIDTVFVRLAQKENNVKVNKEQSLEEQKQNQINYVSSQTNIQVNDYVYRDFDQKLFDKSYNVSVLKTK